jgi:hypothetical protein
VKHCAWAGNVMNGKVRFESRRSKEWTSSLVKKRVQSYDENVELKLRCHTDKGGAPSRNQSPEIHALGP